MARHEYYQCGDGGAELCDPPEFLLFFDLRVGGLSRTKDVVSIQRTAFVSCEADWPDRSHLRVPSYYLGPFDCKSERELVNARSHNRVTHGSRLISTKSAMVGRRGIQG